MGAPSPDLCALWLARAFNNQDVEAAAALYHPDASIVQVEMFMDVQELRGGSDGIRETMRPISGSNPKWMSSPTTRRLPATLH